MKLVSGMALLTFVLLLSACTPRASEQEFTALESQNSQLRDQMTALQAEISASEVDAQKWRQIIVTFTDQPYDPPLPEHVWKLLPDGTQLFFHLDKDVPKATKILYTGMAVPGVWCEEDQAQLPAGFTHFHREKAPSVEEGHAGTYPGEKGYWLMHIALGEFDMPWGHVTPGVDDKFMPTAPPVCGQAKTATA